MTPYLDALQSIKAVLKKDGETHWQSWIDRDISDWISSQSTSHHKSAYGGMGSFNDLWLNDPWRDALFSELKSICYYAARFPRDKINRSALLASMGTLFSKLQGWRCRVCGYSSVSYSDIQRFIAYQVMRAEGLDAFQKGSLTDFINYSLDEPPTPGLLRFDHWASLVDLSGLHIREEDTNLRSCPSCLSMDTAIYRWDYCEKHSPAFTPSNDNVSLRKR